MQRAWGISTLPLTLKVVKKVYSSLYSQVYKPLQTVQIPDEAAPFTGGRSVSSEPQFAQHRLVGISVCKAYWLLSSLRSRCCIMFWDSHLNHVQWQSQNLLKAEFTVNSTVKQWNGKVNAWSTKKKCTSGCHCSEAAVWSWSTLFSLHFLLKFWDSYSSFLIFLCSGNSVK